MRYARGAKSWVNPRELQAKRKTANIARFNWANRRRSCAGFKVSSFLSPLDRYRCEIICGLAPFENSQADAYRLATISLGV